MGAVKFIFLQVAFVWESLRKTDNGLETEQESDRNCPKFSIPCRTLQKPRNPLVATWIILDSIFCWTRSPCLVYSHICDILGRNCLLYVALHTSDATYR